VITQFSKLQWIDDNITVNGEIIPEGLSKQLKYGVFFMSDINDNYFNIFTYITNWMEYYKNNLDDCKYHFLFNEIDKNCILIQNRTFWIGGNIRLPSMMIPITKYLYTLNLNMKMIST